MENNKVKTGQAAQYNPKKTTHYITLIGNIDAHERYVATGSLRFAYSFINYQDALKKRNNLYKQIKRNGFTVTCDEKKAKDCKFFL